MNSKIKLHNVWVVECHRGGALRWSAHIPHNLVPTEGLNYGVTQLYKGAAYTAAWYIGLVDSSPTVAAADTMAAHGGWTEVTSYTEAFRQTLTLGDVASGQANNNAAPGTFSMNAAAVIGGAFLCTDSAVGSANGTLGAVGAFVGGNESVGSGDAVTVRVTTVAAAG